MEVSSPDLIVSVHNSLLDFVSNQALDVVTLSVVSRKVCESNFTDLSFKGFSLGHLGRGVKLQDVLALLVHHVDGYSHLSDRSAEREFASESLNLT